MTNDAIKRLREFDAALTRQKIFLPDPGTCEAEAKRGTGTGACDRPLDQRGQCDRASDHR